MPAARRIIKVGCETCPDSEDVWIEAARMHTYAEAGVSLVDHDVLFFETNCWIRRFSSIVLLLVVYL
jgi:hypothetical protein